MAKRKRTNNDTKHYMEN